MPVVAMAGGGLTTVGLLLGAVALLGLWAQSRQRLRGGVPRRTVPLGAGQALHVVELEGRRLVIGTGPGAAPRLLAELGPRERVDEREAVDAREGDARGA